MAKKNKDRIIYDNDAAVVMVQESVAMQDAVEVVAKDEPKLPNAIQVADIMDTLAGYTIPNFPLYETTSGNGKCLVCGASTAYSNRKLCVQCMGKYGKDLYKKSLAALERGETVIIPES